MNNKGQILDFDYVLLIVAMIIIMLIAMMGVIAIYLSSEKLEAKCNEKGFTYQYGNCFEIDEKGIEHNYCIRTTTGNLMEC